MGSSRYSREDILQVRRWLVEKKRGLKGRGSVACMDWEWDWSRGTGLDKDLTSSPNPGVNWSAPRLVPALFLIVCKLLW